MSSYKFSSAERYAVFLAHGRKCYMCSTPLDLISMEVDHVLPEHLLRDAPALAAAKSALGLPGSFELNSFENWLPACRPCNRTKGAGIFRPSLLVQTQLQRLAKTAGNARRLCAEVITSTQASTALNALERAQENGWTMDAASKERVLALAEFAYDRKLLPRDEPIRLTQSFQLVTTTIEDAKSWGATHWSLQPHETGEPTMVVLFQATYGECSDCGITQPVYQPINLEGGGDPSCDACMLEAGWMSPVALGDLPTHVRCT